MRNFYSHPCNNTKCTICKFSYNNYYFFLKKFFVLPLLTNGNCNSKNAISIIKCILCNRFYIGQTKNDIKTRFYNHFNSIRNFEFHNAGKSEVGKHFNSVNHDYKIHFKFAVFIDNIEDLSERLSFEADLINIFQLLNPPPRYK